MVTEHKIELSNEESYICIFMVLPLFTRCEQKVEYQYDDVNRIYFQYEVLNSLGNKVSLDSVVFLLENFR